MASEAKRATERRVEYIVDRRAREWSRELKGRGIKGTDAGERGEGVEGGREARTR